MKSIKKKYQKKHKRVIELENQIKNFIERVKSRRLRNFSIESQQSNFNFFDDFAFKNTRLFKFSNSFVFTSDKIFQYEI